MLTEILKELDGSDALYDLVDAATIAQLRSSLGVCLDELTHLTGKQEVSKGEREYMVEVCEDILALKRVLTFYSGE